MRSQRMSGLHVPRGSESPSRIRLQRNFTKGIRLPYIESGVPIITQYIAYILSII